ncbi:uncharacterized protein F5Z01DRAFT_119267 [Emericellopsis atlantica]|uniref:Uncharacterized protein n=1 Tax=Emericellopsis atlantica TaxID=2614577 RepID=A0A9P8CNU4_9HYPO|nr:uncharacterized protein F5Z01DRAFT_119267 [Emericellopsis atlantica]KAG9254144.1 hypothetical protein F5Z01DRAFT_119267 [Emericellopsis atlantica]
MSAQSSPEKQPLVQHSVLDQKLYGRNDERPPHLYRTTTPPVVHEDAITIGMASPDIPALLEHEDDWFLADFYAFNLLYRGLGSRQLWLTAADPNELVRLCRHLVGKAKDDSPEETTGHLLHGNPYRDRKVVLSESLIKSGEITMPEVVEPAAMPERWLREVKLASKEAASRNVPLVLLIFCHGAPDTTLELNYHCPELEESDAGARATSVVTAEQLLEVLDPDCRTTILSTACFSGSWVVDMLGRKVSGYDPNGQAVVNTTMLSAADYETQSLAWPESSSLGRSCGSIFASTVINTLTSSANPYLADTEKSDTPECLQPAKPSEEQIETYNSYCRSIMDSLSAINRLPKEHNFTFSSRNDQWELSWPDLVGLEPLQATFRERWEALETVTYKGPESMLDLDPRAKFPPGFDTAESISSKSRTGSRSHKALLNKFDRLAAAGDTVELAKLFLQHSCVDKRIEARTDRKVYNLICQTAGVEAPTGFPMFKVDVLHAIKLRWFLAYVADCMILAYRLPAPCGVRCLTWEYRPWLSMVSENVSDWDVRKRRINRLLEDKGGLHPPVKSLQGGRFPRFQDYLVAALIEAKLSVEREEFIVDSMFKSMKVFENTAVEKGLKISTKDPNLRQPLRTWFGAINRRARSLSPKKKSLSPDRRRQQARFQKQLKGRSRASTASSLGAVPEVAAPTGAETPPRADQDTEMEDTFADKLSIEPGSGRDIE